MECPSTYDIPCVKHVEACTMQNAGPGLTCSIRVPACLTSLFSSSLSVTATNQHLSTALDMCVVCVVCVVFAEVEGSMSRDADRAAAAASRMSAGWVGRTAVSICTGTHTQKHKHPIC